MKSAESALRTRKYLSFFGNNLLSLSLAGSQAKFFNATLQQQIISGHYLFMFNNSDFP